MGKLRATLAFSASTKEAATPDCGFSVASTSLLDAVAELRWPDSNRKRGKRVSSKKKKKRVSTVAKMIEQIHCDHLQPGPSATMPPVMGPGNVFSY